MSAALRNLGHSVRVGSENAAAGLHTMDAFQNALDGADVMLLVITPEALRSRLVSSAWTYFYYEREKPLIPILRRSPGPTDRLNFMLASLRSIDFARVDTDEGEKEAALARLHHTLLQTYGSLSGIADDVPSSYRTPPVPGDSAITLDPGIVHVHPSMPVGTFVGWAQQAARRICILTTWTGLLASQPAIFHEALQRGCAVQILLLNPASPLARQRSLDIHLGTSTRFIDEQEVPRNIQTTIRQLADLHQEVDHLPGSMDLRLYDLLPSFSWFRCDERALIGFFPHSTRMTTFPMLEVQADSVLGRRFSQEFDAVWNHSTVIDFTPRSDARSIDESQPLAEPVSGRETEILQLIVAGWSNQEIADQLVVTLATVKKHINNLYSKLGVRSRTQAILRAHQLRLLQTNTPPSPL
ncbi:MAG: LuxR C-terminal-related transcriptional regulator [Anaerolineae bacterium]|nr:LuxR C-terminal-related transcriptional regulator [Anaerolineae bacterium]